MKFIDPATDDWHRAADEGEDAGTAAPTGPTLFTLDEWTAARATWPTALPAGVLLSNDDELDGLLFDLPRLALLALHFPKWTDGRAYSQARLLRQRHRYTGEIRATGEVLVDMLPLLARTGFSAVQLRADQRRESAERALHFFTGHYQGDVLNPQPPFVCAGTPAAAPVAVRPDALPARKATA